MTHAMRDPTTALPRGEGDDPWRAHAARIVGITPEAPGVRTIDLALEDAAVRDAFRFRAGQFTMLSLPGIGEAAISISSDPLETDTLSHTIRAVGTVTDALARLECGDQVLIRGPFGNPWPLDSLPPGDLVVVGGGLGLASQRAAIRQLARHRDRGRRVTVLHGAGEPDGLLYRREHDAWRAAGIDVQLCIDRAVPSWNGPVGLVTDLLEGLPAEPPWAGVLCCGPEPMMTAVARSAIRRGLGPERVFVSLERVMACAIGQCGLCQLGPLFICQDGPVIRYDRVARFLAVPGM